MAADRENSFKQAERLLRQGKVQAALEELETLTRDRPRDLLLLNRCGDLLARTGHPGPAIGYYERLADQYAQGGFVPKAIAIYKKALRLQAEHPRVLVKLGELCMAQEHTGEARAYLLRAAEAHLGERDFAQARTVYERLVEAEPDDPRHRVRLAETLAAGGETERAGADLVELGGTLLEQGRAKDAERAFARATELLPGSCEASAGRAFSLAAQDLHDEAISQFERAASGFPEGIATGARAALLERVGRGEEAGRLLEESDAPEAFEEFVRRFLRLGGPGGGPEAAWARLDRVLDPRKASDDACEILDRLGRLEEHGHLPALERAYRLRREQDDTDASIRALEALIRSLQARSMSEEADRRLEELREISPKSSVEEPPAAEETAPTPAREPEAPVAVERPEPAAVRVGGGDDAALAQAEAPAVPLSSADEEFVSGHLTEAEVLQKYGLASEALQRLRTVAERFPGHVEAQARLATLIRSQGNREDLTGALVQLAIARRAAGETDGAREAAREATERGALDDDRRRLLAQLGLLEGSAAELPSSEEVAVAPDAAVARGTAAATPVVRPSRRSSAPPDVADEVEIVFDDEAGEAAGDESDSASPSAEPAGSGGGREAPAELLEEIAFYRDRGMPDEARGKLSALRTLGYGGEAIDALESELGQAAPGGSVPVVSGADPAGDVRLDDGDLSDLAAALEAEMPEGAAPGSDGGAGEESLEEVFQAFKRQVEDEVGSEDYRTHYDLGIAYKEMGLLDDAIREFEIATAAPELFREACSMLALCQRQRGEVGEAVSWYHKALEAPGGTPDELQGLRYDLAEALLQQGDDRGALDLFRNILDCDPGYRDVRSRVTELQSRLGT